MASTYSGSGGNWGRWATLIVCKPSEAAVEPVPLVPILGALSCSRHPTSQQESISQHCCLLGRGQEQLQQQAANIEATDFRNSNQPCAFREGIGAEERGYFSCEEHTTPSPTVTAKCKMWWKSLKIDIFPSNSCCLHLAGQTSHGSSCLLTKKDR